MNIKQNMTSWPWSSKLSAKTRMPTQMMQSQIHKQINDYSIPWEGQLKLAFPDQAPCVQCD